MLFELRHPGVQTGAFLQFVFGQNSFTINFWQLIIKRLPFYYLLFANKFWINGGMFFAPFFIFFVAMLVFRWREFWKDDKFKILFVSSMAPIIGTLFFNGSEGNVYEYYYTGFYFIWILLFTKVVTNKWVISAFIVSSFIFNFMAFQKAYINPESDKNYISFTDQLSAADWIYTDTKGKDFNVDEYVPPVVPYAYQYLFEWRGEIKYHRQPAMNNVPLLYTLYEVDTEFPSRLSSWLERQKTIGKIEETMTFDGITVERRERINVK